MNTIPERLVRLSNLAVYYEPPAVNKIGMRRAGIGVPDDAAVYWCCQFLSKYPPQYNSIFARIAKRVRQARFVFIRYQHGACVVEILEERLKRAFAEEGLSSSEHCIFLPPMDFGRFNAVAQLSDVYLDSIGWSGCRLSIRGDRLEFSARYPAKFIDAGPSRCSNYGHDGRYRDYCQQPRRLRRHSRTPWSFERRTHRRLG